jgi:serine/threonine protein kinase
MFKQEKENMEMIKQLDHDHIVKYIATCLDGPDGYVLFPWAEGNTLTNFWDPRRPTRRSAELFQWSFGQMLCLADAVKELHRINCRHGDLKPDNILVFKNDQGEDILVIADLGVSRFHTQGTNLRTNPTKTEATTPSYAGPEVFEDERRGVARSRTYDIWSIGCIFLEYVIWLLYDSDAILSFRYSRDEPFYHFYKGTEGRAYRHSKVSEAMDELRADPRCVGKTALHDLLDLIDEHLLLITVEERYSAEELHTRLQEIVQDAEKDHQYLFRAIDPRPIRPTIFQLSSSVSSLG